MTNNLEYQSKLKYPINDHTINHDQKSNRKTFVRLFSYLRPYLLHIILGTLATALASLLDAYLVSMLGPIIDRGIGHTINAPYLRYAAFALLVIIIFRAIFLFMSSYLISYVSGKVVNQIRSEVFTKFIYMPRDFYDETPIGTLQSRLNNDVAMMTSASSGTLVAFARDLSYSLGLIGVMFYNSWKLSIIIFITMPIIIGIAIYVMQIFKKMSQVMMNLNADLNKKSIEMLRNHNIVQHYGGQEFEQQRFDKINNQTRLLGMKLMVVGSISSSLIVLLASFSLSVMIFLTSFPVIFGGENQISAGQFTAVFAAMFSLSKPLRNLTTLNVNLQVALTAAYKVLSTLDLESELDKGTIEVNRAQGEIEFKNVSFRYFTTKESSADVLHDLSIVFKPDQMTALVGKSGSGKTTLVNLITRLYQPTSGTILLDGVDIYDYQLKNLRSQISVVSQASELFNDTLYNNIVYSDKDKYTEEQVIEAAKQAYVWEFVKDLPDGLDTMVGEAGMRLSGGQRQRLSIARALLRNSPIIIFDEATSALDNQSERYIQESISQLQKGRTLIVIAHRLTTIANADNILVMANGKIVEQGNHQELLEKKNIYAKMYFNNDEEFN